MLCTEEVKVNPLQVEYITGCVPACLGTLHPQMQSYGRKRAEYGFGEHGFKHRTQ